MNVASRLRRGRGDVTEHELTDATVVLDARRVVVGPGERSPEARAAAGETFLYVIAGTGRVRGGGDEAPLGPESVVWLDEGDAYALEAGPGGLELLLAHAPAA